jgi:glycerophosphoryl diester phosphodiesterase
VRPVPYVAAHRGASKVAPENTLAAFRAALDHGAAALELDVHLTRDERIVVIHDDTLDRTTNASGPVSALTGEEIRSLDAGSWFGPAMAGERVPYLEEVIELTEDRARLHVELKGENAELLAARVVVAVRRLGAADRVFVMSFGLDAVRAARDRAAQIPAVVIVGQTLAEIVGQTPEDQLGFVRSAGLNGLNQSPSRWALPTIERFRDEGLLVHGSLVNDRAELNAFFGRGGDMADSDAVECYGASPPAGDPVGVAQRGRVNPGVEKELSTARLMPRPGINAQTGDLPADGP